MTIIENKYRKVAALMGLSGVIIFSTSLIILGNLNSNFNFIDDFVSKLGAKGEPNAIWWNSIGFGFVGMTMIIFGALYGKTLNDKLAGIVLSPFGVGFAFVSIPIDLLNSETPVSKAHIIAVCLALAFWLFGLARISYNHSIRKKNRNRADLTAILIVIAIIGLVTGSWSMPITHRLVFLIVFGWTAISAIELLTNNHA
ncbi:MAG: putative membrane protein YwzB [Arcticibacterium sp.]|jgi:uncharacterized membrane protein YwzB